MPLKRRYLVPAIKKDLKEKMVFLGGPRQVGKTTLARDFLGVSTKNQYYTWDKIQSRRQALKGEWDPSSPLIILDEFHKYPKWKSWLKGEYDTHKARFQFLVTGSARLDIYRRGGDSLQGRYHYYRLHPFSLAELIEETHTFQIGELVFPLGFREREFETLLKFGGFPEPFLSQNERDLRRWHNERLERFFREDIRDLTRIQDMGNLSLLTEILPQKVSSILSINSISQDLQVNFRTVANWLDVLENFYHCFRISPYFSRKIASVRKEKKLYLWDWSEISGAGAKFENLIASHLLKFCHYLHDYEGWKVELSYLRDETGREVDFLVCHDNKPWFAVEAKCDDTALSKHLFYFREKLKIPYCFQVVQKPDYHSIKDNIHIISASRFLTALI